MKQNVLLAGWFPVGFHQLVLDFYSSGKAASKCQDGGRGGVGEGLSISV